MAPVIVDHCTTRPPSLMAPRQELVRVRPLTCFVTLSGSKSLTATLGTQDPPADAPMSVEHHDQPWRCRSQSS